MSQTSHSDAAGLEQDDIRAVEELTGAYEALRRELGRVIVGQDHVVAELLIAVLARSHAILEGVPGLAKTLLVSTLARCMRLEFARIQFTPDLMPSDITGTEVIQEDRTTGERSFRFLLGPIFANVILADEINRTPPKTQAALLESMQERQVSVGGRRYPMKDPFFVLATQNPIEQEGTYPLPEAQQDRFMFKIAVHYPSWDEEFRVVRQTTGEGAGDCRPVIDAQTVLRLQRLVRRIPIAPHVTHYAMRLVRSTRVRGPAAPRFIRESVSWGAGVRGCQYLILGGKARAVLHGRFHVSTDDVAAVAKPVLRHRIITNHNADAEGITSDCLVDRLLETIPAREGRIAADARTRAMLKAAQPKRPARADPMPAG